MNTTIRSAQVDDAIAVWEIRTAAILSGCCGYYPEELLAIWTNGEITERFIQFVVEHFYVATVNDEVVGTGAINLDNGQLDAIFVRPDMMGRGVGMEIISFLENAGRAAGLKELSLDSTLNAAPFYRRRGFVGETVGTYESPRGISLDCIPMTKQISSPGSGGQ